jgi:hypothetical protein
MDVCVCMYVCIHGYVCGLACIACDALGEKCVDMMNASKYVHTGCMALWERNKHAMTVIVTGLMTVIVTGLMTVTVTGLMTVIVTGLMTVTVTGLMTVIVTGLMPWYPAWIALDFIKSWKICDHKRPKRGLCSIQMSLCLGQNREHTQKRLLRKVVTACLS